LDDFFKKLRELQKKERANSSLSRVGNDFYERTHKYLDELRYTVGDDPFSNEHYLLKDTQRIATEICERREHKIADAAVVNIHRSYHLFKGKPEFDLLDTTPLNLTNEEEKLYFTLIDILKSHRENISLDNFTNTLDEKSPKKAPNNENSISGSKSVENKTSIDDKTIQYIDNKNNIKNNSKDNNKDAVENIINDNDLKDNNSLVKSDITVNTNESNINTDDNILKRLNVIKNSKIIDNESKEDIDKQILKPKVDLSINTDKKTLKDSNREKKPINQKNSNDLSSKNKLDKNRQNVSDKVNNYIYENEDDQFIISDDENQEFPEDIDQIKNTSIKSILNKKIVNETILIFKEVSAIVGIDEKIYGPFRPQDVVTIPDMNAQIIVKNKKGRLVKI
jgi:DNA replication factor GINS